MNFEDQYLAEVTRTINEGVSTDDRTGTGTVKRFGVVFRHDLSKGFPLLTTKKINLKNVFIELNWMLSGSTNTKYLVDNGCNIWNEWADENGELKHVYGKQWADWDDIREVLIIDWNNGVYAGKGFSAIGTSYNADKIIIRRQVNQIQKVVDGLRNNPNGRRHMFSAWNAAYIDEMALPPCHVSYDFVVTGKKLNCLLFQRSQDTGLGCPYNEAALAMLTMMMAQQTGLEPGEILLAVGDSHVYKNHINPEMLLEQVKRVPRTPPELHITKAESIFSYTWEDFKLEGYDPLPNIRMPVSV